MTEFIQVITAVTGKKKANEIAVTLLSKRLASCVQVIGPVHSTYRWKGKIKQATEWSCLVKARMKDYPLIEANIKKMHPYDVPEILAFPVLRGNTDYLKWIRSETVRKVKRKDWNRTA